MLARRFTIVCLLMSLFGMFFAILVSEAGRAPRTWQSLRLACLTGGESACAPLSRD